MNQAYVTMSLPTHNHCQYKPTWHHRWRGDEMEVASFLTDTSMRRIPSIHGIKNIIHYKSSPRTEFRSKMNIHAPVIAVCMNSAPSCRQPQRVHVTNDERFIASSPCAVRTIYVDNHYHHQVPPVADCDKYYRGNVSLTNQQQFHEQVSSRQVMFERQNDDATFGYTSRNQNAIPFYGNKVAMNHHPGAVYRKCNVFPVSSATPMSSHVQPQGSSCSVVTQSSESTMMTSGTLERLDSGAAGNNDNIHFKSAPSATEKVARVGDDSKWILRFEELKAYKAKHGDCLVPTRSPEYLQLGPWVSTQRAEYKKRMQKQKSSRMTPERIRLLESIGFAWNVDIPWNERFKELIEFKEHFGHCSVPRAYSENPALGRWVHAQRSAYKIFRKGSKSKITVERIKLLENIGFSWRGLGIRGI